MKDMFTCGGGAHFGKGSPVKRSLSILIIWSYCFPRSEEIQSMMYGQHVLVQTENMMMMHSLNKAGVTTSWS